MIDEESLTSNPPIVITTKKNMFNGYKIWALSAILILAIWSMFTGSVSLKWSSRNLSSFSDQIDFSPKDDLDILEVEESEKIVKKMWDVYTHGRRRLPSFWQQAFEAAYQDLVSDVIGIRNAAVSEIAKLSILSLTLPSPGSETTTKITKQSKKLIDGGK